MKRIRTEKIQLTKRELDALIIKEFGLAKDVDYKIHYRLDQQGDVDRGTYRIMGMEITLNED